MENCALCGNKARMFCESDEAKLCWECDEKVHGANFLVAKHTRVLLCRTCQCLTPWKACGPKLTPTHSLCNNCATSSNNNNNHPSQEEEEEDNHHHVILRDSNDRDEIDEEDGEACSSDDDESGYDDDDEEGEDENQVVPWSPPLASSASANCSGLAWKRPREGSFVDSDDEIGCSSSEMPSTSQLPEDDSTSWSILRPWKYPRSTQQSQ